MREKHRRGPCPDLDKQRVKDWYNKRGTWAYNWVQIARKRKITWHRILGYITGTGL